MSSDESFISHLVELRFRLIRVFVGFFLGFLPCAYYARELYSLLAQPLLEKLPQGGQMIATEVVTPFFVPMKVAMMAAFIVTLPHTLYQIWAFVAPGLYSHEKRLVLPLVLASSFLFICGMAFAYFAALPLVFEFITHFAPEGVAVMTDISRYLDFVLSTFIAFGITFEVPIFVVVLVRVGIVSIEKLKEIRRYVLVGAFVAGAIFTPPMWFRNSCWRYRFTCCMSWGYWQQACLQGRSGRSWLSSRPVTINPRWVKVMPKA